MQLQGPLRPGNLHEPPHDSNAAEKMIGKIEGIDTSASSLEVTMELSCKGQLSVLINGGDPFII